MDDGVPLAALEVAVSPVLVGSRTAVRFGNGPVYVSPAMYELIRHATPDELRTLLERIPLLRLPDLASAYAYAYVPMFTQHTAGEPSSYNYAATLTDLRAFKGNRSE